MEPSAAAKKYERGVGDKSVPARHRVYGAEDIYAAFDAGAIAAVRSTDKEYTSQKGEPR